MMIRFSPQAVSGEERIKYYFNGNKITVEIEGKCDDFNFNNLPDGELKLYDEKTGEELIETTLPVNPIRKANKVDGTLYLELLNWISENASYEECFPEWIDAKDYKKPVIDEKEHDSLEGWDEF